MRTKKARKSTVNPFKMCKPKKLKEESKVKYAMPEFIIEKVPNVFGEQDED